MSRSSAGKRRVEMHEKGKFECEERRGQKKRRKE